MKYSYLSCFFLLLAAHSVIAQEVDIDVYRTFNGTSNNLDNPDWGATHTALLRISGNGFADSISAPAGPNRPNPRAISNILFEQEGLINDPLTLSDYCWVFGQFIDHDIALTENNEEPLNILVPSGDPDFDPLGFGTVEIPMRRNIFMEGTGLSVDNPRQYPNEITAFIDGSAVYGSDQERADWLRTFEEGKLKVSTGNLLPYNTVDGEFGSELDPTAPFMGDDVGMATRLFVAGDIRANENPLLIAFHTLFVREHNRQCDLLVAEYPDWTDQELYLYARKITSGLIQSIVYNEWLPTMGVNLPAYSGYDPTVHPQLANVFSAAAFRLGHTLLNGNIRRVDAAGEILAAGNLPLRFGFFNPSAIAEVGGLEPYLRGMGQQNQQQMDAQIVDDVRNFLFGPPGAGGLDLASININRGRERGLPSFNRIRLAYGLTPYTFIEQVNPNVATYAPLFQAYFGDIRRVDPWVGMLAEEPMPGGLFGETILKIMEVQFGALRDGDRFFYLNDPLLTEEEIMMITNTSLRDIIMYNTDINQLQDNVFLTTSFDAVCDNMTLDVSGGILVQGTWDPLYDTRVDHFIGEENVTNIITNGLGVYSFSELSACEPNVLTAERNDTWINGLTVQDIVIIQRHILGLGTLSSPYQYLAADVNFNEDISVTDIVAIRRLILDLDQEFGADQPWQFVTAGWSFSDPDNPWADEFPSTLRLAEIPAAQHNQGFVAYKLGDVDASASLSVGGLERIAAESEESEAAIELVYVDQAVEAGEVFDLKVMISPISDANIDGLQFGLELGDKLSIEASPDIPFGEAIFANTAETGELRFVAESLEGAVTHFHVLLRAREDMRVSEEISISTSFPSLAVTTDEKPKSIRLQDRLPEEIMEKVAPFVFYPNPFDTDINLTFNEPLVIPTSVELADPNGRVVRQTLLQPGTSQHKWFGSERWAAGHYCYSVRSGGMEHAGCLVKH
ncbi:MAG: peroxidase family protein [Bacteroidota bacterium]